jgi:hypothetical protein
MAMAFCMMESSSWCRYLKRRKRRRRLLQKHGGGKEAGFGSRARHWNGIKSGVTGGWTSRDYNFQLISSSDKNKNSAGPPHRALVYLCMEISHSTVFSSEQLELLGNLGLLITKEINQ